MIRIFVDNAEIFIANKDFSYVEYNSVLDAAKSRGGLTLDIDVPLDCAENMRVYENVARLNARGLNAVRRVKVYHDAKLIIDGIEKILEFNSKRVKIQVLTDNSEVNNISNGKKLRELDLGDIPTLSATDAVWTLTRNYPECNWVCPPLMARFLEFPDWHINNAKVFNEFDENSMWGNYRYKSYTTIVAQPYLLYVIERVLRAIGYEINNNTLLEDKFAHRLYIAHGITAGKLNLILPDWTVEEFLLEIQKLLNVVFKFNYNAGRVDITNTQQYYRNYSSVFEVKDDMIVYDDQSPSVKFEDIDVEAMDYTNVKYAVPRDNKYYAYTDVEDEVLSLSEVKELNFNITEERVNYNKPYIYQAGGGKFIMKKNSIFGDIPEYYGNIMQYQHSFNTEDKNVTELKIIPALGSLLTVRGEYGDRQQYILEALVSLPYAMFNSFNIMASEATEDKGFNEWIQNGVSDELIASVDTLIVAQYLGMRHIQYQATEDEREKEAAESARYPMSYVFNPIAGGMYLRTGETVREIVNLLARDSAVIRDSDVSFNLDVRKQNGLAPTGIYEKGKVYKFKIYTNRILDRADAFRIFGNIYIPVKLEYSFNNKSMRPYVEGEFVLMKI